MLFLTVYQVHSFDGRRFNGCLCVRTDFLSTWVFGCAHVYFMFLAPSLLYSLLSCVKACLFTSSWHPVHHFLSSSRIYLYSCPSLLGGIRLLSMFALPTHGVAYFLCRRKPAVAMCHDPTQVSRKTHPIFGGIWRECVWNRFMVTRWWCLVELEHVQPFSPCPHTRGPCSVPLVSP